MKTDLLVIWSWEYDAPYLEKLKATCAARGVSIQLVGEAGLKALPDQLESGEIQAACVIDRAWDAGDEFELHVPAVKKHIPVRVNEYDLVRRTWNKPTMHFDLIARGLQAPHMLVVASQNNQPHLHPIPTEHLGKLFSIKAAHSGGSGILKPGTTWNDVMERRRDWPADETILQPWIQPDMLGDKRAWFRVFYSCGVAYPCWADDTTHVQTPITPQEEHRHQLDRLRGMTAQIAGICGLNVFSTEIALGKDGVWRVMDYVNDPCDFRPKSLVVNGVPDEIVDGICAQIVGWVARRVKKAAS
ncbi:MAG TPA: hypothetical protein PLJ62_07180 [Thermoflexales bacterium]|nr:hypothetical protein [Thermoflexales bacterium]HQZ23260.1 hypothetical protein [Thermoflexales bacterium]HQZ99961.1 hypothetical protein [Thermoflexales bacterium]